MTCKDCRKIRYCMERHRGICTSFKGGEKHGKTGGNSDQEEKAFWFVIGFSIALMICCVAFGQTINA